MKQLLLFLLPIAAWGACGASPCDISLGSTQFLSYTAGGGTNHNIGVRFRSDNFPASPASRFYFFNNNVIALDVMPPGCNSVTPCFELTDHPDSIAVTAAGNGCTDCRIKAGRDLDHNLICIAVWDGAGNFISSAQMSFTSAFNSGLGGSTQVWSSGTAGNVSFVRSNSTFDCTTNTLTPPSEAPSPAADNGDFRFENSLTDSGAAAYTMTLNTGSATYNASPTYNPISKIVLGSIYTATAGAAYSLNCDAFDSLYDNGAALTYAWTTTGSGSFSVTNTCNPTYTPPASQMSDSPLTLTVTDTATNTGASTVHLGAVNLASDGKTVIDGFGRTFDEVVNDCWARYSASGSCLTKAATEPWTYFSIAEPGLEQGIATAALANPPTTGTAISGTVTLGAGGSATCSWETSPIGDCVVGSGTTFTTALTVGKFYIVEWNSADGTGTGRYIDSVTSIVDDTHAVFSIYGMSTVVSGSSPLSGLSMFNVPAITSTFDPAWWGMNGGAGTNSWNYYGACIAYYRMYARTGLNSYLDDARQFADYWWQWAIDHGSGSNVGNVPRAADLQCQYARAVESGPSTGTTTALSAGAKANRLAGLFSLENYFETGAGATVGQDCGGVPLCEQREAGYTRQFAAFGAIADSTNRSTYCGWLTNTLNTTGGTPGWIANQNASGNWTESEFLWNNGFLTSGPGSSPWRSDVLVRSHQLAYDVLSDTTICNQPAFAATMMPMIKKAADWIWSAGRSTSTGGIYYSADGSAQTLFTVNPTGTVSITNGTSAVVGVGTTFTTDFSGANFTTGSAWIGFYGPQSAYKISSITDDTHLTIAGTYGSQGEVGNLSGAGFAGAPSSFTTCNSTATGCEDGFATGGSAPPNPGLDLDRFPPILFGWCALNNGCGGGFSTNYYLKMQHWLGASYGGPADGPNGVLACDGPYCQDAQTDWATNLFTGNNAFSNLGKNTWEGLGSTSAADSAMWINAIVVPSGPGSVSSTSAAAVSTP